MAWHVASRFGNGSIINALALSGLQFEEGAQVQREEGARREGVGKCFTNGTCA